MWIYLGQLLDGLVQLVHVWDRSRVILGPGFVDIVAFPKEINPGLIHSRMSGSDLGGIFVDRDIEPKSLLFPGATKYAKIQILAW